MNAREIAHAYVNAWNSHNTEAVVNLFTENGSYADPNVSDGIAGPALAGYISALIGAFPDLKFDLVREYQSGDNTVIAEWIMRGTNNGSLRGLPPTEKTIALPGIDVIEVADGKISSVRGYFNGGTMMAQLGLQVLVQPEKIGPVSFGSSTYTNIGNKAKPGVIGVTYIQLAPGADKDELKGYTRDMLQEIARMPGYISTATTLSGDGHGITVTAWQDMESAKNAVAGEAHKKAMKALFANNGLGQSAWTSLWTDGQLNTRLQRCEQCGSMGAVTSDLKCKCGAELIEPAWF